MHVLRWFKKISAGIHSVSISNMSSESIFPFPRFLLTPVWQLLGLRRLGLGRWGHAFGWPGFMLLGRLGGCFLWLGSGSCSPVGCCTGVTAYHAASPFIGAVYVILWLWGGREISREKVQLWTTCSSATWIPTFWFRKEVTAPFLGYITDKLPSTCSMTAITENNFSNFCAIVYCVKLLYWTYGLFVILPISFIVIRHFPHMFGEYIHFLLFSSHVVYIRIRPCFFCPWSEK